jgi:predicted  nucleic acid-binding Zn-ribbon protein
MSTKPDWKTKPHERKRMTLQQENQKLKERIKTLAYECEDLLRSAKHFREKAAEHEGYSERYRVLRTKDVMVLDGEPKYLKGEDLDNYCDEENSKFWGVSMTSMTSFMQQIAKAQQTQLQPTKLYVNPSMMDVAKKLLKEQQHGNDARSKSKEADQKDSGHYTDLLRYAHWYGVRK